LRDAIHPPGIHLHVPRLALGGAVVLRDLSLSIEAGRTTCLLGPSGAGKTTLLRLIAGLMAPPQGARITTTDARPLAGRIAFMAQSDLLFPWLDVLGNATLGARLRGQPPDRARAMEVLARVGLGAHARRMPATLSGGQRQRAALARTLMEDFSVVLLDEPFSAVDLPTRLGLQDLAATLFAGRTVLMVTHDPMEALRLAHRIFVLTGTPARATEAPVPESAPPRAPDDLSLLEQQGRLLALLKAAAA
jgi:putative hydroxymethylpyrimidine transport system ATP-binding protein